MPIQARWGGRSRHRECRVYIRTRTVFAGERTAGKRDDDASPVNNSLTALDRPREKESEWGLSYKKINDSATSQFTVGPPYARYRRGFPLVRDQSTRATTPRHIANFSTNRSRDSIEEVGLKFRSVDHAAPEKSSTREIWHLLLTSSFLRRCATRRIIGIHEANCGRPWAGARIFAKQRVTQYSIQFSRWSSSSFSWCFWKSYCPSKLRASLSSARLFIFTLKLYRRLWKVETRGNPSDFGRLDDLTSVAL